MGHNSAGANRRARIRRRKNIERIRKETECLWCGKDCRKAKSNQGFAFRHLCDDCDAMNMLFLYEESGLVQDELIAAAVHTSDYWTATEEDREDMRLPALDYHHAVTVLDANARMETTFHTFIQDKRLWERLSDWYFHLPGDLVFAGGEKDFRFELQKDRKEGTLLCMLIDRRSTRTVYIAGESRSGTDERRLAIKMYLEAEEAKIVLCARIENVYCTEKEYTEMLQWLMEASPDCKPLPARKTA